MVVRERRKAKGLGETKDDMLGAMLEEEAGGGLSDEMIVDFLVSLLVAGYETTSTTMTLAVKYLTETPLALAQLKVTSSRFTYFKTIQILYPIRLDQIIRIEYS